MDRPPPDRTPSAVREAAIALWRAGDLTPAALAGLVGSDVEVLYDLIELPYDGADVDAVDAVRAAAVEAADTIVAARSRSHDPSPGQPPA